MILFWHCHFPDIFFLHPFFLKAILKTNENVIPDDKDATKNYLKHI